MKDEDIYTHIHGGLFSPAAGADAGHKHDDGKLRYDLLPPEQLEDIVKVLTYGASKYTDCGWISVSEPKRRYYAAAMRHLQAWNKGEVLDKESNLPHLAHVVVNMIFLMWFNMEEAGCQTRRTANAQNVPSTDEMGLKRCVPRYPSEGNTTGSESGKHQEKQRTSQECPSPAQPVKCSTHACSAPVSTRDNCPWATWLPAGHLRTAKEMTERPTPGK